VNTLARQQRLLRSRRSFFRAVGASALAYPFLRALEISAVEAQEGDAPQRFISFYYPHGVSSPLFRRQSTDTEDDFDLTFMDSQAGAQCVLAPFDDAATYGMSFKDRIIVLDGLDFVAGAAGHDGTRCIFTGSGVNGKGSSIEQYLAVEAGLGKDTPFSSLVLGVGTNGSEHTDNIAYSKGVYLPKVIDPTETFNSVFAAVVSSGDPDQAGAAEAKRQRGQSVIDYIRGDIQRLSPRLAAREKAKLDQHLTSLFDLEKQLAAFEGTCEVPGKPPSFTQLRRYNGGEPNFDTITNLQLDMLAQALVCDLTRFGSFWMADLSAGAVKDTGITDPLYSASVDVHNSVAHTYSAPYDFSNGGSPGAPSTWASCGTQQRYAYGKAARFVSKLAAGGVLDSSLVAVATDMGDTAGHSSEDVPYVLIGSAGGKLRTGRHIALKPNCPPGGSRWCSAPEKVVVPNNRLLVSIAQTFGQQVDSFGEPTIASDAQGALTELA
jgi:Protein of unknown function (DUF1552)